MEGATWGAMVGVARYCDSTPHQSQGYTGHGSACTGDTRSPDLTGRRPKPYNWAKFLDIYKYQGHITPVGKKK